MNKKQNKSASAPIHLGVVNKTINSLLVLFTAGLAAANAATAPGQPVQIPISQMITNGLNANPRTLERNEPGSLVSAIKSDLANLQKNLAAAVEVVYTASKTRHEDYTKQVTELSLAISEAGMGYLGDNGPLLKASGDLSAKLEANKKRLQDRAQKPELDEVSRTMCIKALEDLKGQLEKLGGARAALKLVRSDLLAQAKRLAEAAETVAIIEETAKDSKAVEVFIDAIRQVGDFAKSLEKRLSEIGGPAQVMRVD